MIRRTGLSRQTPLTTRAPLGSTARLRRRVAGLPQRRVRHAATGHLAAVTDWEPLRGALWGRCAGFCEACDAKLNPDWWDAHHRLPRSHGGTDTLPNLVALHPGCHTVQTWSVHIRPAWAYDRGLLIHTGLRPADVPLELTDGRLVALTADGRYLEVS